MATDLLVVRDKVQRFLTGAIGRIEIDKDGDFSFRQGSAQVYINIAPFADENSIVTVFAHTNRNVPVSAELFKHIACDYRLIFGSLFAYEKDGLVSITLSHKLLGEFLDPDELITAIGAIAFGADEIDDKIKTQFGGEVFHEE